VWTRLAYPQCIIDQRAVQLPGVSFTLGNHRVTRRRTRATCRGRPTSERKDGMTSTQHSRAIDQPLPRQRVRDVTPPTVAVALVPVELTTVPARPARRDVMAIKASLAAVRQEPVALAESFYAHLFEMAPAARAMFRSSATKPRSTTMPDRISIARGAGPAPCATAPAAPEDPPWSRG